MVRAQIRGWGGDGNLQISALVVYLIFWMHLLILMFCPNFCSFHFSANHFSVTFNSFFKKYISFVLSQYKNKAHCTYCSIGKFFCLFKWLLFLLTQCSTVSCHGPLLSSVGVSLGINCKWKVVWGCEFVFVGLTVLHWTWPGEQLQQQFNMACWLVVPNVYHWFHQVLDPELYYANCSPKKKLD